MRGGRKGHCSPIEGQTRATLGQVQMRPFIYLTSPFYCALELRRWGEYNESYNLLVFNSSLESLETLS
jgi:hypothetical protein